MRLTMRLGDIALRLECRLEGPEGLEITGVAGLEEASDSELTFLANPKYHRRALKSRAAAIIVGSKEEFQNRPLLRSSNPYLAFAHALELFATPQRPPTGIHPTAAIASSAKIGCRPSIGAYVVIEDGVVIGDDCIIKSFVAIYPGAQIGHRFLAHSHSVVRENVWLGDDVILQSGAVVGSDGFGFARKEDGSYFKIVQPGKVIIEDHVEVQANSCIDRASVGETRLRRGVKVDNLVQVGHGCDIGENTLLCGQVGLAGSTRVGRNVLLAGQVGVAGHLTIGDNVIASSQSGIPNDVQPNCVISGYPAMDNARWLKCCAAYARLPEIYAAFRKVRRYLEKMESGH
jgi:UDP-3-O-[3-hydroxymyristoyl] glucosamine N-acyltransferase